MLIVLHLQGEELLNGKMELIKVEARHQELNLSGVIQK